MGQIIGGAAKPKRCNLNQLSQVPTPASGEHILVSSDNSMNAAGQGNFDCFIKGDGSTAAAELKLNSIADESLLQGSKNSVSSGAMYNIINGIDVNYEVGGYYTSNGSVSNNAEWARQLDYIPINTGDVIEFSAGVANSSACFVQYTENKTFLGYYSCSSSPRTVTLSNVNAKFARLSFSIAHIDSVYIKINGVVVWKPSDRREGIAEGVQKLKNIIGGTFPISSSQETTYFALGLIRKSDGSVGTSTVNYFSQKIDITGYEQIQFVAQASTNIDGSDGAAFYDSAGAFISSVSYYDSSISERIMKTYRVPIPSNAKYFAYTCYVDYISYSTQVTLIKTSIVNELSSMSSRIDAAIKYPESWVDGKQIYTREGVGNVCSKTTYDSASFRCFETHIAEGQKVLITKGSGGISPRLWCFLDSSNVILSVADASESVDNLTLTAPANSATLICNDTLKTGDVYIYDDDIPLNIRVDALEESAGDSSSHGRTSNCKDFGTQPAANGSDSSFCNVTSGTYNDLLTAVYEPLRTANPNYISRVNIGKDASGTIDMYAYVFEPRYYQQCIYLQAGIHGIEVDAVACLARIMQLITNATGDDEDLMWMRQNVKIVVIPCVNVWGFSQPTKSNDNYNGASLQQWSSSTPPAEVANIKAFIDNNALTDELSFMLDMHTTTNDTYYDFYGNIQRHAKNVRTIFRTNAWLCDNYALDGRTVDDQYLGYHEYSDQHLFRLYYYYYYNVQTATLELSDYHWDSSLSTSAVITMGVTMWMNYIIQMTNDFYRSMSDIPDEDYRESRG